MWLRLSLLNLLSFFSLLSLLDYQICNWFWVQTVASSIACSCFLCLVLSSFALSWLAWAALPACAFRSNATQVSPYVGSFFGLVAHFFEFLTHLKLSCVFATIFCDFGSIFRSFGKGLGRILGGFFDDFWWFFRKALNGVEGHETLRGRMNFEGRLLKKHVNFVNKKQKHDGNLQ